MHKKYTLHQIFGMDARLYGVDTHHHHHEFDYDVDYGYYRRRGDAIPWIVIIALFASVLFLSCIAWRCSSYDTIEYIEVEEKKRKKKRLIREYYEDEV